MSPSLLKRELGVFGATLMGLGSIVGTGVFVSIPMATEIAGPGVIWAVTVAALVAVCNGLNSAQLAANHPVSGGTYEYGYKYLNPWLGFTAGWMFLVAKTTSAATAALGFAGYFLSALGVADRTYLILTALIALATLTLNCINWNSAVSGRTAGKISTLFGAKEIPTLASSLVMSRQRSRRSGKFTT
ncbi:APC family permease [Microcoleus sp. PH2017_10_PVI_O_A]|uniref:APC family permease n=1 Tax=Microcoleus sp. PH2017_10_PVI_O_A TaxID=2798821 RepID=UPI0025CF2DC6|nr:amino acid permease [Microcoleus sp. PH2017_10_PVI_O_A]